MTSIDSLFERAGAGGALGDADRAALYATTDLLALGMAADEVRRRRHGARVTFVRVAVVVLEGLIIEQFDLPPAAGEVRLVGALDDLTDTATIVGGMVDRVAGRAPVTGFSLADVEAASGGDRSRAARVLSALRDAGLSAVAEAPLDGLQAPGAMLDAARDAGLPVLRFTVDRAPAAQRATLLDRASILTGRGVEAFAPLPRGAADGAPSTGFEDVRLVALARLLVDVPHIQVDWSLYGPKLAQVGLTFGADDVDAVSPVEETSEGRRRAPLEEIRRNILAASGEAAERDGLFRLRG